jgi:hypothetical protein
MGKCLQFYFEFISALFKVLGPSWRVSGPARRNLMTSETTLELDIELPPENKPAWL